MRRGWRWAVICALLAGLVPLFPLRVSVADDVVVTNCTEAGFDAALATAQQNGGGSLSFACGAPTTIPFTTTKSITAGNDVVVLGQGHVTFDGGSAVRLFSVAAGAGLELHDLTLINGRGNYGGAIESQGTLVVTGSTFSANRASGEDGGAIYNEGGSAEISEGHFTGNVAFDEGGAIRNDGIMTISDSTFTGNTADDDSGAIVNSLSATLSISGSTFSANSADEGGALGSFGTATITASTFSSNIAADGSGGAIFHFTSDPLTVVASTFSGNSATGAGGSIYSANGTVVTVSSTILTSSGPGGTCNGSISSGGYNLVDDGTCGLTAPGDIPNSDNVNLGPLADNGGPTPTMLPDANSDAINAADCVASTSHDQRGVARPPSGVFCDIGAVEVGSTATFCASRYTGAVSAPPAGAGCPTGTTPLAFPLTGPLTFCINPYTGALLWTASGNCAAAYSARVVPGDGPLSYCRNIYTGKLRYSATGACSAGERPGVIPGA